MSRAGGGGTANSREEGPEDCTGAGWENEGCRGAAMPVGALFEGGGGGTANELPEWLMEVAAEGKP